MLEPISRLTALAEFYVHDRLREVDQESLEAVANRTAEHAKATASEIYSSPVRLDVRVRQGSLIEWITVFGVLGAFLHQYPGIKAGAGELIKDARRFGDGVGRRLKDSGILASGGNLITLRRRKVPGLIYDFVIAVERLDRDWNSLDNVTQQGRLAVLNSQHEQLLTLINDDEVLEKLENRLKSTEFGTMFPLIDTTRAPDLLKAVINEDELASPEEQLRLTDQRTSEARVQLRVNIEND